MLDFGYAWVPDPGLRRAQIEGIPLEKRLDLEKPRL